MLLLDQSIALSTGFTIFYKSIPLLAVDPHLVVAKWKKTVCFPKKFLIQMVTFTFWGNCLGEHFKRASLWKREEKENSGEGLDCKEFYVIWWSATVGVSQPLPSPDNHWQHDGNVRTRSHVGIYGTIWRVEGHFHRCFWLSEYVWDWDWHKTYSFVLFSKEKLHGNNMLSSAWGTML